MDGDAALANIPREEDPFWEPPEDILVGTANVFLQSLAYALDFDDKLSVTDYKVWASFWVGKFSRGEIYYHLRKPCLSKGNLGALMYYLLAHGEVLEI